MKDLMRYLYEEQFLLEHEEDSMFLPEAKNVAGEAFERRLEEGINGLGLPGVSAQRMGGAVKLADVKIFTPDVHDGFFVEAKNSWRDQMSCKRLRNDGEWLDSTPLAPDEEASLIINIMNDDPEIRKQTDYVKKNMLTFIRSPLGRKIWDANSDEKLPANIGQMAWWGTHSESRKGVVTVPANVIAAYLYFGRQPEVAKKNGFDLVISNYIFSVAIDDIGEIICHHYAHKKASLMEIGGLGLLRIRGMKNPIPSVKIPIFPKVSGTLKARFGLRLEKTNPNREKMIAAKVKEYVRKGLEMSPKQMENTARLELMATGSQAHYEILPEIKIFKIDASPYSLLAEDPPCSLRKKKPAIREAAESSGKKNPLLIAYCRR